MIPLHDDIPSKHLPYVTLSIIVICLLVFLWQFFSKPQQQENIIYALGVIPSVVLGNAYLHPDLEWIWTPVTLLTYMFLHGGWMHLIGNMLYLWIFGNNVEDSMGHIRFLLFYTLCGIMAVFAQAIPDPDSVIPMVGASGGVSGILGAYLLLHPRARILVAIPLGFYFPTVRLPAALVLGLWFVLQLFNSLMVDNSAGGVAFAAHIGGFLAGLVLIPLFKRREVRIHNPFTAFLS